MSEPKRRLRACVESWPEAESGEYNPACCRFPKSCSATVYDPERVTEDDLEPAATTEPTCTCHVVPEQYWTTHYGATEPGSTLEPDWECPVHFPASEPYTGGCMPTLGESCGYCHRCTDPREGA